MEKFQSIQSWYPILNWKNSPNFQDCHQHMDYRKFRNEYYVCDKLARLELNLTELLKLGRKGNFRLVGPAGCGKTSFVYYLLKKSLNEKNTIYKKYFCHVFHSNRADHPDYEALVRDEILVALKKYFGQCKLSEEYARITDENHTSRKEKINRLTNYFKENKDKFQKTMIFIIDDVDMLSSEMAFNIAQTVLKNIEIKSVIKTISIRPATYNKYSGKTKKFLEEFFPSIYTMPDVSVCDILKYRIKDISTGDAKNPFSKKLCDNIVNVLFDGNKRAALGIIGSIIEDNLPKNINKNTSEEFIQNYLEKAAVNTFIAKDALPNLHSSHLRILPTYPLPLDILLCAQFTASENLIFGSINDIAQERSRGTSIGNALRKFQITTSHFNYSINALVDENLIIKETKNIIRLTNKGKIQCAYASRDHYHTKCKYILPDLDQSSSYWEVFNVNINHEKIVNTFQTWVDHHSQHSY